MSKKSVAECIRSGIIEETATDCTVMHQCGAWFFRFAGEPEAAGRYIGLDTEPTSRLVSQAIGICANVVIPTDEIDPFQAEGMGLEQWGVCD